MSKRKGGYEPKPTPKPRRKRKPGIFPATRPKVVVAMTPPAWFNTLPSDAARERGEQVASKLFTSDNGLRVMGLRMIGVDGAEMGDWTQREVAEAVARVLAKGATP